MISEIVSLPPALRHPSYVEIPSVQSLQKWTEKELSMLDRAISRRLAAANLALTMEIEAFETKLGESYCPFRELHVENL